MRTKPHVAATPALPEQAKRLVPFLKVTDVAEFLNISPRTVRQMVREGRLTAVATSSKRGRLRISHEAVETFLREAVVGQESDRTGFCDQLTESPLPHREAEQSGA